MGNEGHRWRNRHLLLTATTLVTVSLAALLAWWVASNPTSRPDFAILWAAMQVHSPYDPSAVGAFLGWPPNQPPTTFVYPPSAMPVFAAFASFRFEFALVLWAGLSGAALGLSSRSPWAPLIILTPAALWALPGGPSIIIGALVFGTLQLLHRPALAGVLLGLALSLKPQLVLLIFVALLFTQHWRTILAAMATFAALTLVSALLFGPEQWLDWLRSLPPHLAMHEANPALRHNEIAFGLPATLRALVAATGVILTVRAFRPGKTVEAFAIAVGCSLIASPHAMGYEFAVLSPAYVALIARRGWSASAILLLILTPVIVWAFGNAILPYAPRLIAVALLILAAMADGASGRPQSRAEMRPV